MKLLTPKEYRKARDDLLDKQFSERYPLGQFVLQIRKYKNEFVRKKITTICSLDYVNLYLNFNRRHTKGIGVENSKYNNSDYGCYIVKSQNNSFGTCYYFKTLSDLVDKARLIGVDEKLISVFIQEVQKHGRY